MREKYLRVKWTREGVEYIVGLELRPGDRLGDLKTLLRIRAKSVIAAILPGKYEENADAILKMIDKYWPDRRYFIEVGDDSESWVQVFDPRQVFGVINGLADS